MLQVQDDVHTREASLLIYSQSRRSVWGGEETEMFELWKQ